MNVNNLYTSPKIANTIKTYAKSKHISLKDVLINCELGSNTFSHMLHGRTIAFDSLAKIADYLDCSVDYLLGRIDTPKVEIKSEELSSKEKLVISAYRDKKEYQNSIDKMLDIV